MPVLHITTTGKLLLPNIMCILEQQQQNHCQLIHIKVNPELFHAIRVRSSTEDRGHENPPHYVRLMLKLQYIHNPFLEFDLH